MSYIDASRSSKFGKTWRQLLDGSNLEQVAPLVGMNLKDFQKWHYPLQNLCMNKIDALCL